MKRKKKISLPAHYLLMILTVLCVGGIVVSMTTNFTAVPLNYVTGYLFVPIQKAINQVGQAITSQTDHFASLKEVQEKNAELKKQVDELTVENSALAQEKYELRRLRKLYDLDESYADYDKIAARVIGNDAGNWFNHFMIDKGTEDGISVDMNVISDSGLVGIVIETGKNWATVRSIIDDASNISSMMLDSSDRCIVSGNLKLMNEEGMIEFSELKLQEGKKIEIGEKVVTSHISDKYLQGILIGYVTEIGEDENKLTYSGTITPVVDFEHLQEVLVITDLKQNKETKEEEEDDTSDKGGNG